MGKAKKNYRNNLLLASVAIFAVGVAVLFLNLFSNHQAQRGLASLDSLPVEEKFSKALELKNFSDHSKMKVYFGKLGSSLCDTYKDVVVEFEAQDVAVSGDRPKMSVKIECDKVLAQDGSFVVRLPNQLKADRKPSSVNKAQITDGVHLSFDGILWVWPTAWSVSSIEFHSEQSTKRTDSVESPWLKEKKIQW